MTYTLDLTTGFAPGDTINDVPVKWTPAGPGVYSVETLPLVGNSRPAIMRSVVVLPQPLGPSIEKNSPS